MLKDLEEFKLLNDKIQGWIIGERWKDLRSIQKYSIQKILKENSKEDLILFDRAKPPLT